MANPEDTDVFTSALSDVLEPFQNTEELAETGSQDAEGKDESVSQADNLSLSELNTILKREFTSKEEALKSIEGLKNLVGDQELAKERKEKAKNSQSDDKLTTLEQELAELKKANTTKDFLIEAPDAKEYLDVIEAYAEKQGITLNEAWTSKFQPLVETSQKGRVLTNKNRITPVESQEINNLAKVARQGDTKAQEDLVMKTIYKS